MVIRLLGLVLALANATILMSGPWTMAGVWWDAEPVVAAFHAAGALTLLVLALGAVRDIRVRAALYHPLVLLPLAIAAWTAVSAVFAEFPGLAFLGAPQTGQGVLWYVDLAAFTAAGLMIGEHAFARRLAVAVLIAVVALAAAVDARNLRSVLPLLTRWGVDPGWSLFYFNDFLVYYAYPLVVLGWRWWRQDRLLSAAALAVALFALLLSDNRTALVAVALVAVPVAVVWGLTRGERRRWLERPAAIAGMAATVALISLASYVVVRQVPNTPALANLWSRAVLARAVEPTLGSARTLLVGAGWGHYQQEMVRHIGNADIRLFDTEWLDISHDEFHSHNLLLESALAAGIPGALLTLALAMAVVWFAAPRWRLTAWGMAMYAAILDGLWFQLPVSLAAIAMATAAVAGERPVPAWSRRLSPAMLAGVVVLLALVCAAGATLAARTTLAEEGWKRCLEAPRPGGDCLSRKIPTDDRQTRYGIAVVLNDEVPGSIRAAQAGTLSPERAVMLHLAVAEAADLAPTSGLSLALAVNNAYSLWSTAPAGSPLSLGPSDLGRWDKVIEHVQRAAPDRADLIAPYVNWLLAAGRDGQADLVVARSEAAAPSHPVPLWFRGILTLGGNDARSQAQGLAQLRTALRGGVERYMPVPADVKATLTGSEGR